MIRTYWSVVSMVFIAWMTCCSPLPKTDDYKIAIVASQTKQPGIVVMKPDSTEKKLLVADSTAQLTAASWSPIGNKIAFFSDRPSDADILNKYKTLKYHYALHEVDVASGKEKRLLNFPVSSFRWSPDSKHMLFISSYEDPGQVKCAVYIFDMQTGEQKQVTPFGQGCYAAWSPDGSQIAFSMSDEKKEKVSDVYTVSLNGQNKRCLTDSKFVCAKPAWSPDGKTIAYGVMNPFNEKDVEVGVYAVNSDGANKRQISNLEPLSIFWSPDGKSLLIQKEGGVTLIEPEGNKSTSMAPEVGFPQDMVFTPDGKKAVFRSDHEEGWHIYFQDISNKRIKRISDLSVTAFCLSPLGAK
jgi:Tol biopolymer transport system component